MARRPLLTLTFYGYDASDRNDGHRQPEIMTSRRPHPPRFIGVHRYTSMPIRFKPRNSLPRMRHEARRSYDSPLCQRIKLVGVSCGRPVPLEQPAITGNSFEGTGRRSATGSLRSRGDRRRTVPSATGIKNGTVNLPFSREELMGGILNDDSTA